MFAPGFQRGSFNCTFHCSHSLKGMIACCFRYIRQPGFAKILLLVVQGSLRTFIFNRFISHNDNYLNHRNQTKVSFLKDFSKILSLSPIFVTTWQCILSEIDLIVLPLAISFIIRTFFLSCKIFFVTSYIARRIMKLIAWATSFIEERVDFEITLLI